MMSDAFWMSMFGFLGTIVAGVIAWLAKRQSDINTKAISSVHKDVNSRLSELVEAVRKGAHAAGVDEERKRQTDNR